MNTIKDIFFFKLEKECWGRDTVGGTLKPIEIINEKLI